LLRSTSEANAVASSSGQVRMTEQLGDPNFKKIASMRQIKLINDWTWWNRTVCF